MRRGVEAVVVACLGTLAALLFAPAPASAAGTTVYLDQTGARGGSVISVDAGDSVTFVNGVGSGASINYSAVLHANPSVGLGSDWNLRRFGPKTLTFANAGSFRIAWDTLSLGIKTGSRAMAVQASAVDPGTPSPPPSTDPGGGGPTDGPGGGSSSSGTAGGGGSGGSVGPGLPGGSSSGRGGASFTFGPHPDTGTASASRSSARASSSAASSSSAEAAPIPFVTTSVLPAQNVSSGKGGDPPTPLAIIAIIAFAAVAGTSAFLQFGPNAARLIKRR